jgi:lysophospholipase L1-like esterase
VFSREILLLILSAVTVPSSDSGPPPDPDPNRFAQEIATFAEWDAKNAVPAHPVLFVGSSSIRMWRTRECFPDLPVVNRGFGGSHVSDVIHFAARVVLPYQPKIVVFYAGDNDIAAGKSARRVFDDYRKFVELVRARLPETRIIFISIKPSASRWFFWPVMQEANELVRDYCNQDRHLLLADLATPLLGPDGRPSPDLFLDDRLHLNAGGYAVWTEALGPVLERVLEAPRPPAAERRGKSGGQQAFRQ